MKQLFFAALLTIIFSAKAQIVLEHEYESASTIYSIGPEGNATNSQLMYVNFELSGERYIVIDRWEKEIRFYDMSHVLLSTVSIEAFPVDYYGSMGDFLYFSQNLFDTDDKIEFMYVTRIPSSEEYYTGIYKEDGTLIFSENAGPFIRLTIPTQQYPIYNTSAGTKMILSYTDKHATVFGLPGTLVSEIAIQNQDIINELSWKLSSPYPNPSVNTTRIEYKLPEGIYSGEIVFYDLQGKEIKRFKVDSTFDSLSISTSEIPAGTYYYQLQTSTENSEGKKMVVIK